MFQKIVRPDSFYGFDTELVSLMKVCRNGCVDSVWMQKRASIDFSSAIKTVPFDEKQYEPVHLIALGDYETYGPNRNGDAFSKEACISYHKTFEKHAKVYREHKNKAHDPSYGIVIASGYNEPMGRVELVVGLDKNSCSNELQKIANQEPVSFSMSCTVPYDVCSECNHKSQTRAEYCDHLKSHMLQITKNGSQICAFNPQPLFKDISIVGKRADRIAISLGMAKAASYGVISGAELAELILDTDNLVPLDKRASTILDKLGRIRKKITAVVVNHPVADVTDEDNSIIDKLKEEIKTDPCPVFTALAKHGVVLPPSLLSRLIGGDEASDDILGDLFSGVEGLSQPDRFKVGDIPDFSIGDLIEPLINKFSVAPENVARRGIMIIRRKPGITITITKTASQNAVNDYRTYQIKLAEFFDRTGHKDWLNLMVLDNMARASLNS